MNSENKAKQEIEVAAIVVCFNPDVNKLVSNVSALLKQFATVIVVDNSDIPSIRKELNNIISILDGVCYLQLSRNYGIAYAQNIGVQECIKLGYKFFCEFDQDSTIEENFVGRLIASYLATSSSSSQTVAAIGPNALDADSGKSYRFKDSSRAPVLVEYTLSSGLFVSVDAFLKVGPKSEDLFIDLVDWEWCLRARSLGFQIYIDPDIKMLHKLGDHHKSVFGLFEYGVPAPFRHYYAFRNYIKLSLLGHVPLRWKIKYFFINCGKLFLYPFIMNHGFTRFKFMIKGLFDGLMGKSGRLP